MKFLMKFLKQYARNFETVLLVFLRTKMHFFNFISLIKEGRFSFMINRLFNILFKESFLTPAPRLKLKLYTIEDKDDNEILAFPKIQDPMISIIIPVYDQWRFTKGCLKSILENTNNISYEIIVSDDGSTDETIYIEKYIKNITIIRNQTNLGFLKNCNAVARKALGKYIVLLNNDTNVQPGWLTYLLETFDNHVDAGLVGSKLIYPNGLLQEAGGIIWNDATGMNYGNAENPLDSEYNYIKEVDYISGAAIMIKKDLWNLIGGFDERFSPAYYEDTDLAFQVRKQGFKVLYQPLSVVVHFEGISHGTKLSEGIKKYQNKNRLKFKEKWKDVLKKHSNDLGNIFIDRDRTQNKKIILVIDRNIPTYDKDAGSKTILQYFHFFLNYNFVVKFLCLDFSFNLESPYIRRLQQLGIEVLYGRKYLFHWKAWLEKNQQYLDFVIINRPDKKSMHYLNVIKKFTHIKILYFGHDLHYLRLEREFKTTGKKYLQKQSRELKKLELSIMRHVDLACFFSQVECDEISWIAPEIKTKSIPLNIYDKFPKFDYDSEQRKDILFVGGFNHVPNRDGIIWFVNEIFPLFKISNNKCILYIVGSNPCPEILELSENHIVVTGYVTDRELEAFYKKCKLVIAPLRFGAGVKGKIVEALYYGMPVVTTNIGIEGLKNASEFIRVTDDPMVFSEFTNEIYQDCELANELSRRGKEYCQNYFSEEYVFKQFSEILND